MPRNPLAVDLFCGLGGWTDGLLAEGYDVAGFDIERHAYGDHRYPADLVLQDVRTIHGRQFKEAALIVASPPCQAYSYMAMPWTRGKQIAAALRGNGTFPEAYTGPRTIAELNELFEQPRRIQREAIAAAGRFIPMVQENVRGAIPWVGRSQWHYGSFHLWGDVPALMPTTVPRPKVGGVKWYPPDDPRHVHGQGFNSIAERKMRNRDAIKNSGGSWFAIGSPGQKVTGQNPVSDGVKTVGHINRRDGHSHTRHLTNQAESDGVKGFTPNGEPMGKNHGPRRHGSRSSARKAASAKIAMIPLTLARHIAYVYHPNRGVQS